MTPGKFYKVTREIILHKDDFDRIQVDDWWISTHDLGAPSMAPIPRKKSVKRYVSAQVASELKALYGAEVQELFNSSSSCTIPIGSLVFYAETSERTGNHKLIFGEFIGWTDLIEEKGLFEEVATDAER